MSRIKARNGFSHSRKGGTYSRLICISHHLPAEARHKTAMTSLRLVAVLGTYRQVRPATPKCRGAKRLAPRFDDLLTHFALPGGEKCRLWFRLNRQGQVEAAPESVERFERKVREIWCAIRSVTSRQLRDEWRGLNPRHPTRSGGVSGGCIAPLRLGLVGPLIASDESLGWCSAGFRPRARRLTPAPLLLGCVAD